MKHLKFLGPGFYAGGQFVPPFQMPKHQVGNVFRNKKNKHGLSLRQTTHVTTQRKPNPRLSRRWSYRRFAPILASPPNKSEWFPKFKGGSQ